jgi:hypothetical protein
MIVAVGGVTGWLWWTHRPKIQRIVLADGTVVLDRTDSTWAPSLP